MAGQFVIPYRKDGKNDANDAEGLYVKQLLGLIYDSCPLRVQINKQYWRFNVLEHSLLKNVFV